MRKSWSPQDVTLSNSRAKHDIVDRHQTRRSHSRSLSFRSIHQYICEAWSQTLLAS